MIYGHTDSIFCLCRGRSKEQAFKIGRAIAKAVTDANPPDVELKFEYVFTSCIFSSINRYSESFIKKYYLI